MHQRPAMDTNHSNDIIRIDVDSVIRQRLPRYSRFIPRALTRLLEKAVCQDSLNEMLRVNRGKRDADFCRGVIDHLGITYSVVGNQLLPADPRAVFVCNHPLGGLDGMILIDMLTRHSGRPVRFVVNDLLMAVEPLRGAFLPINKHGRQSRQSLQAIDQAFASDCPVIIFPAGLVSRKGTDGRIRDLEWQKMFVNKAIESERPVIPLHFSGSNSSFFYNFAKLRKQLHIPFNIEMLRLPAEVFRCRGARFTISVAAPIPWTSLRGGAQAAAQAAEIKRICYSLEKTSS